MKAAALLVLAALATPAAAEIGKWVDREGRLHYGDRAQGDAFASAPLRGTVSIADGITIVPALPRRPSNPAPAAAAAGEVWVFTTARCGYCAHAKEHLRLRGIPFLEKDIEAVDAYREEFRALGGRGVPMTVAGSSRINGYQPERYEQFLRQAGF